MTKKYGEDHKLDEVYEDCAEMLTTMTKIVDMLEHVASHVDPNAAIVIELQKDLIVKQLYLLEAIGISTTEIRVVVSAMARKVA